jgi:hypothetical protein
MNTLTIIIYMLMFILYLRIINNLVANFYELFEQID